MAKHPDKGWNKEWITSDANDDVIFSGYQPAIIFKRKNTLARGQGKCDFHFYNSKEGF